MDGDTVSASSSQGGVTIDNIEERIEIWSVWKKCEDMLKENNYMMEFPCVKTSPKIMHIAKEMYNRIAAMFNEMEVIEDEELVFADDLKDIHGHEIRETNNSDAGEETEWEEEPTTNGHNSIPLEYKKKVVAKARAHPNWSLETLRKNGAALLKKKAYLKTWEAEIAAGGTVFDKYEAITNMTFKRFQKARENSEQITTTMLQQWALIYARELNCSRFVASTHWINKFRRKHGIRRRKITRFVGKKDR